MNSRNTVIGVVAAVLVVALAVGGALLQQARGGDLALPDRAGGMPALDTAAAYESLDPEDVERAVATRREAQDFAAERVAEAFGGAEVDVRSYGDVDDVQDAVEVTAIAADAGPLLPEQSFTDPERLGLALPLVERTEHGDVECLVWRRAVPESATDVDDVVELHLCQRSSGTLTVRARVASGDVDGTVGLVEELWDELG